MSGEAILSAVNSGKPLGGRDWAQDAPPDSLAVGEWACCPTPRTLTPLSDLRNSSSIISPSVLAPMRNPWHALVRKCLVTTPLASWDHLHKDETEEYEFCVWLCYYMFVPGPKQRIWNVHGMTMCIIFVLKLPLNTVLSDLSSVQASVPYASIAQTFFHYAALQDLADAQCNTMHNAQCLQYVKYMYLQYAFRMHRCILYFKYFLKVFYTTLLICLSFQMLISIAYSVPLRYYAPAPIGRWH